MILNLLTLLLTAVPTYNHITVGTLVSKHDCNAIIATDYGVYAFPVSVERVEDREIGDLMVVSVYKYRSGGWMMSAE